MSRPVNEENFQIGTVARLTGLTVHCIRAWETRYGVVSPVRSGTKRRIYSREDIRRLTLLKSLVDSGHSIGTIADLTISQLEDRIREDRLGLEMVEEIMEESCRAILVGSSIKALFSGTEGGVVGLQVVGQFENLEAAVEEADLPRVDLAIVSCPTVFPETIDAIRGLVTKLGARRCILVYGFAQSRVLRGLFRIPQITAIRGPVNTDELRLACLADIRLADTDSAQAKPVFETDSAGEVRARKFTDQQLSQIVKISSSIQCECPQHLASLLFSLTAFETYSAECENRSPEDAELHAYLYHSTAKSRVLIEDALERVMEVEGIKI